MREGGEESPAPWLATRPEHVSGAPDQRAKERAAAWRPPKRDQGWAPLSSRGRRPASLSAPPESGTPSVSAAQSQRAAERYLRRRPAALALFIAYLPVMMALAPR